MKKKFRMISAALALSLIFTSAPTANSRAAVFNDLDVSTAVAGASRALSHYYEVNEDAVVKIAEVLSPIVAISENKTIVAGSDETANSGEKLYDAPLAGVAKVESLLNLRESPSTLSPVVAMVVRGSEVKIVGERIVNGNVWYKASVAGTEGYAAGNYIALGTDAEVFRVQLEEEKKDPMEMPARFEIKDDLAALPADLQGMIQQNVTDINYCLNGVYAEAKEEGEYVNAYSVLIWLLENYMNVQDISNEYGLTQTFSQASEDIAVVELNRSNLSELTGQTEEQFFNSINEEANRRAEEEAAALAAELQAQQALWAQQQAEAAAAQQAAAAAAAQQQAAAQAAAQQQAEAAAAAAAAAAADPNADPAAVAAAQQAAADAQAAAQAAAAAQQPAAPAVESHSATGDAIVAYASQFIGSLPYIYGGASLSGGADCSGFASQIYAQFGLIDQGAANSHAYTSYTMRGLGVPVDPSQMRAGDLVCYNGHVAIYAGDGMIIHEPAPGRLCEIGSAYNYPIVGVRRLCGD